MPEPVNLSGQRPACGKESMRCRSGGLAGRKLSARGVTAGQAGPRARRTHLVPDGLRRLGRWPRPRPARRGPRSFPSRRLRNRAGPPLLAPRMANERPKSTSVGKPHQPDAGPLLVSCCLDRCRQLTRFWIAREARSVRVVKRLAILVCVVASRPLGGEVATVERRLGSGSTLRGGFPSDLPTFR